jgi:hypothetical protein
MRLRCNDSPVNAAWPTRFPRKTSIQPCRHTQSTYTCVKEQARDPFPAVEPKTGAGRGLRWKKAYTFASKGCCQPRYSRARWLSLEAHSKGRSQARDSHCVAQTHWLVVDLSLVQTLGVLRYNYLTDFLRAPVGENGSNDCVNVERRRTCLHPSDDSTDFRLVSTIDVPVWCPMTSALPGRCGWNRVAPVRQVLLHARWT